MDSIKKVEEIGIDKVAKDTHIEQRYLRYMVDLNFEKLDYVNTLGFIRILSREYGLDLSDFREAFEKYWEENRSDEQKGLFVVVEEDNQSDGIKKFFIFLLFIFIIAAIVALFSTFKDKINFFPNETNSTPNEIEQSVVVEEAKDSLEKIIEKNDTEVKIDLNETNNSLVDEDNFKVSMDDQNQSSIKNEDIEEDIENEGNGENLNEQKDLNETVQNQTKFVHSKEAIIVPNAKLWVGVINLEDKTKRSYLGDGNFTIDLRKNQIISTGHGDFSIHIGKDIIKYERERPVKLLIKDGNLTKISDEKFLELNEGKLW